ncbi:MAG: C39 family peptidase [Ignavibacteriales bacterium]|nr:C39 family peptidase [Ignavibacteriales bacterium]
MRYQFFIGSGGSGTFTGSFVQNVYYNLVGFVFNSPAGIYNATNVTVNASGDTATIGFKVNDAGFTSISAVFTMTLPSQNHVDHFAITSNPDTIKFGETSVLKIQAKDAANNDTDPPAGTKANIVLNVDEQYGNLEYNGIVGKAITNIPYEDARDGKVIFSAKTKNPLGLDPQQVPIGFTTVPAQYEGSTTVVVKPTIQKFCQQDGRWVGQNYDSYKQLDDKGKVKQPERQFTIGDKGCALSCMAMVLNAVGLNYTPLSLNEAMTKDSLFMKNNKGNWNGGVNWRAVAKYASSKLQPPQVLGSDLNWTNKTHLNLTDIDNRIQDKDFILALVGNPNRGDTTKLENHWVLITDKADGKYQILDPGRCDNSRPTLDSYSNKIYKVIIYKRKP